MRKNPDFFSKLFKAPYDISSYERTVYEYIKYIICYRYYCQNVQSLIFKYLHNIVNKFS